MSDMMDELQLLSKLRCGEQVIVKWAVGEIVRLRTIVDKLPTADDGVPVVPGMILYTTDGRTVVVTDVHSEDYISIWRGTEKINYTHSSYSTRAAAEAAKEAADGP